ncbi:MAG TPA: phosphotransferase [archaeon]|nr:phosphotransferase [archaeon]
MGELEEFLAENHLSGAQKISKGWSSDIFLAQDTKGRKFVLKVLHAKSNRRHMSQKETEFLKLANSVGIGPHWLKTDFARNIVMMEFIDGVHFSEWVFGKISKSELENFIDALFAQARALDEIGLDHGQLAGKGKNILVRGAMPVIIDFEKASRSRKVHNVKVLESFLFRSKNSAIIKKIKETLQG